MPKYRQSYTLFKRGKYYYYRTYTPDGVRTTAHTTGCTSLTAARLYCDKLYKEGRIFVSSKTFSEYAKDFFNENSVYVRDNALSTSTIIAYNSAIKTTFIPLIGNRKLEDITHTFLKSLRQAMLDAGMSPATIRMRMKVLHIVVKSAYLDGIIARDPFDFLRELKEKSRSRDALTIEEVKLLYNEVPDSIKPAILILALTGMRMSEFSAVSAADVLEDDGIRYIHLERQYLYGKFQPLKNKKPRDIPISAGLAPFIKDTNLKAKKLFTVHVNPVIKTFKDSSERLLSAHSLRHFFISSSKSYGVNHLKVEAIAGHSLKGIQEVYTSFHVQDLAEIIKWQEWAMDEITGKTV